MQERHINRGKYFEEQSFTTEKYVIPFIQTFKNIDEQTSVLEIGCGEGGNLAPFAKKGCKRVLGIDMSEKKIQNAHTFFKDMDLSDKTEFIWIAKRLILAGNFTPHIPTATWLDFSIKWCRSCLTTHARVLYTTAICDKH